MEIDIIKKGRLSLSTMGKIIGGSWTNCSGSGTACPKVSGDNFSIIKNCEHNLYTCGTTMVFCVSDDDLAACSGLPSDAKGIKRPI